MKNMTKLKLSFTSLAFALPLAISGCSHNPPQTGNMMSNSTKASDESQMNSTTTSAKDNMTPSQMGHTEPNSMNMAGSSMNNMTPNNMNMAHSPQTGNMMSGSMGASNQSQMSDMTTNSTNKMATPQMGNMESHP
jgi:hypothetical protein